MNDLAQSDMRSFGIQQLPLRDGGLRGGRVSTVLRGYSGHLGGVRRLACDFGGSAHSSKLTAINRNGDEHSYESEHFDQKPHVVPAIPMFLLGIFIIAYFWWDVDSPSVQKVGAMPNSNIAKITCRTL
jgi:hypothetical protein